MSEEVNFYYKIVLIGNGRVGKTSLRRNFMGETFNQDYAKTLKADFASYQFRINDFLVDFSIWDLAGQPEYSDVQTKYYYGAFGAIIVFDVTNRASFENLDNWVKQLVRNTMSNGTPIVIAANKVDLDDTEVKMDEVKEYVKELGEKHPFEVHFIETSALIGKNVEEAFTLLTQSIYRWKNT